jgi:hypothetical protein
VTITAKSLIFLELVTAFLFLVHAQNLLLLNMCERAAQGISLKGRAFEVRKLLGADYVFCVADKGGKGYAFLWTAYEFSRILPDALHQHGHARSYRSNDTSCV